MLCFFFLALDFAEAMWRMNLQPAQMEISADDLPYPERPGEPDCSYYMRTGSCGFGSNCKFNHSPARKIMVVLPLFAYILTYIITYVYILTYT